MEDCYLQAHFESIHVSDLAYKTGTLVAGNNYQSYSSGYKFWDPSLELS